jgi:hypothetical protein
LLWVVLHCRSWRNVVWNDAANVCVNCHRKILFFEPSNKPIKQGGQTVA